MAVLMTLLRVLVRLLLGLVVLVALLYFLVISNLTQRLIDDQVYYDALNDTDAYNRIYDEVLVDEALREQTDNLLGNVQLKVHDEVVALLREILPPDHLQEQLEDNIERLTGYMNGEADQLEIYLELRETLVRIPPAVLAEVHRVIDALDLPEPEVVEPDCSPDAVRQLAADAALLFQELSSGRLPESVPSLQGMDQVCREQEFARWFEYVVDDQALGSRASALLAGAREELRQSFVEGDARAFLKVASESLVGPLARDAIEDIRSELLPGDRLDLIQMLADQDDELTKEEIEESAEAMRELVTTSHGLGRVIALVVAVVGSVLLALVHWRNTAHMLRWPGAVLAFSGAVSLIVGYSLNSAVPGVLKNEAVESLAQSGQAPESAIKLAGELMESLGHQVTAGFVLPATIVILVAAALIAASFLAPVLKRRFQVRASADSLTAHERS